MVLKVTVGGLLLGKGVVRPCCHRSKSYSNLLPVAVPHPTAPQHGQPETNSEEREEGKEEVRHSWSGKGEVTEEQRCE